MGACNQRVQDARCICSRPTLAIIGQKRLLCWEGAYEQSDSSSVAFAALTPTGRRRYALASKMLLWSHFVEPLSMVLIQSLNPITKNPANAGLLIMVPRDGMIRAALLSLLSPLRGAVAALWRPKCSCGRILSNRCRWFSSNL